MGIADSALYKKMAGIGKVGAAAGSFLMPAAAPALLGGAFGGDAIAKANPAKRATRAVQQSKEMLAQDVKALRNDPMSLGLTGAEQEKMRADAVQTTSAQNQAQATQLSQAALAGQGFQQGAFQQAQEGLGEAAADAGLKAGAQINDLNNRIIEQKRGEIMSRLEAERDRIKENTRFWMNMGIQGVGAVISAAMGVPSPLQGLGAPGGSSAGGGTTEVNIETPDDLNAVNPATIA